MYSLIPTVLAASLLGSAHCAGMCGGFVAFYAGTDRSTGARKAASHLSYHGGRLVAYMTLGALAGGLGQAVDLAGSAAGLQQTAAVLAGAAMVAWGLVALARSLGAQLPHVPVPAPLQRGFGWVAKQLQGKPPLVRAGVVGLASALLPCGWLYAFVVTAAGTGSSLWGAVAMAAFWLGTLPLLVGLGVSVQHLAGPLRAHLPKITAVALVAMGLLAVTHRATMPRIHRSAGVHSAAETLDKIQQGKEGKCCHDDAP